MRYRVASCRRHLAGAGKADRGYSHEKMAKSFIRHVDENGDVYHTVATKEQGRDMPKKPDSSKLFAIPDLVIDLDAESLRVREFTKADEERLRHDWEMSPRRRAILGSIGHLRTALGESRSKRLGLSSNATQPLRMADRDITSVALRGFKSQEKPEQQTEQDPRADKIVITSLSQPQHVTNYGLHDHAQVETREDTEISEEMSGIAGIIELGDPRRRPDYMRQLRISNGIPSDVTSDNGTFLRWMLMLRSEDQLSTEPSRVRRVLTKSKVANAIRNEQVMRRNITSIRRIVFHSIETGVDISSTDDGSPNIPREIRDACARILDKYGGNFPPYYEVLTFVNNLAARMPGVRGDLAASVFALRLRTVAGLGLVDLAASQMDQHAEPAQIMNSFGISKDVEAAAGSWLIQIGKNPALQSQSGRRQLFRVITGFGEDGTSVPTSYRNLILHPVYREGQCLHLSCLQAFGNYLELLGRLGAVRMLWKEFQECLDLFKRAAIEEKVGHGKVESSLVNYFRRALIEALDVRESSSAEETLGSSLRDCAALDVQSICESPPKDQNRRGQMTIGVAETLNSLNVEDFAQRMELPLGEWLSGLTRR